MKTVWSPVVMENYMNMYEVSNTGCVKSLKRFKVKSDRLLKCGEDNFGYPSVSLNKAPRSKAVRVHVLVASAFIGSIPVPGMQVNHKNGVKKDNRVENLEWVTPLENMRHMFRTGLRKPNILNPLYPEIFSRYEEGENFTHLSKEYGIPESTLSCAYLRHTGKTGTVGRGGNHYSRRNESEP